MLSGASSTSLYSHHVSTYGLSSEMVKDILDKIICRYLCQIITP